MSCNYCAQKKSRKATLKEIYITERHIQALWLEQKYLSELFTSSGAAIKVLSPGIWNLGAGPDFQKAHILIAGKSYYGAIELHLTAEAWFQHQHHIDAQYNNVILHVVLWQPRQERSIFTANHSQVACLYLEHFLTVPVTKLWQLIDVELYPYKHFLGAGRCAQELFKHMTLEQATCFLQQAADFRLAKKRLDLHSLLAEVRDYMAAGMAMALGFKNNAATFLALFLKLKEKSFKNEHEALAWLLGMTGFFAESFANKWGQSTFYRQLKELYVPDEAPLAAPLILGQTRPLNHPIRRLALMVKICQDAQIASLLAKAESLWQNYYAARTSKKQGHLFLKALVNLLPNYTDAYWNHHYLFERKASATFIPLLGGELKREILSNVLFPFLADKIFNRSAHEAAAFRQCYGLLPAASTGKARYLRHRFFGDDQKGSLLKHAYCAQGAYQIHKDYCVHYEASCEGCPFVSQHKSLPYYQAHQGCCCSN